MPIDAEELIEKARNHATEYNNFDRAVRKFHLAEAHLIAGLHCVIRDARSTIARLTKERDEAVDIAVFVAREAISAADPDMSTEEIYGELRAARGVNDAASRARIGEEGESDGLA